MYEATMTATTGRIFLKNLDTSQFKVKSNKKKPSSKAGKSKAVSFPIKLYQMLEQVEQEGRESIVSWNPDGKTFQVHKHERFAVEVLPEHFKQSKYKSFQRQLNFYAFQRIVSGPLEGSYGHPLFIRGNPDSCKDIKRVHSTQALKAQQESFPSSYCAPIGENTVSTCTEALVLPLRRSVTHEMNVADIAALFQQHPADDFLVDSIPDISTSLMPTEEDEDRIPDAFRRDSSLLPRNVRLSFLGENFFTTQGESLDSE